LWLVIGSVFQVRIVVSVCLLLSEKENVPEREDNNQKNEDDPNGSGFGQ